MWSLEELKSIDDGGSFNLIIKEIEKDTNDDELLKFELLTDSVLKEKIWSLEELKSIDDGGSFDLIVKETEKATNGDELLKLELLTDSLLR
ncbi:hypothetical protein QYF36_017106 [Acer negundo]|nr:hypothetical protein QYF36_017106 [Acer negundo]